MNARLWPNLILSFSAHAALVALLCNMPLAVQKAPRCIEIRLIAPSALYGPPETAGEGTGAAPGAVDQQPAPDPPGRKEAESPPPPAPKDAKAQPVALKDCKATAATPPRPAGRKAEARPLAAPALTRAAEPHEPVRSKPGEETGGGAAASTKAASTGPDPGHAGIAGPGGSGRRGGGLIDTRFGTEDGPSFARQVKPNYPGVARRLGKEGTVVLRITIDERGSAVEVEVLSSAGAVFEEEAIRAVRASKFIPAKLNGEPVKSRAVLPVRFALNGAG